MKSEAFSLDHPSFDHAYYATTPPSSNGEDEDGGESKSQNVMLIVHKYSMDMKNLIVTFFKTAHASPSPGSPTARLLLEYEQHLRNTLAKGMDAESYSLHTFEAIISQSNENLGKS